MKNVISYYDLFAHNYLERRADGLMLSPIPYKKFFGAHMPPMNLIDLGCGPGFESELALTFKFDVTGIDFSPRMIELFKKRNPTAAAILADLKEIPCPYHSFDLFLSSFSLLHCNDDELYLRLKEISRVVKPNAHGLFMVACSDNPLRVEQIHREAKNIASIYPIPFFFRSFESWKSVLETAGFEVEFSDEFAVAGSAVRAISIFCHACIDVEKKL